MNHRAQKALLRLLTVLVAFNFVLAAVLLISWL